MISELQLCFCHFTFKTIFQEINEKSAKRRSSKFLTNIETFASLLSFYTLRAFPPPIENSYIKDALVFANSKLLGLIKRKNHRIPVSRHACKRARVIGSRMSASRRLTRRRGRWSGKGWFWGGLGWTRDAVRVHLMYAWFTMQSYIIGWVYVFGLTAPVIPARTCLVRRDDPRPRTQSDSRLRDGSPHAALHRPVP